MVTLPLGTAKRFLYPSVTALEALARASAAAGKVRATALRLSVFASFHVHPSRRLADSVRPVTRDFPAGVPFAVKDVVQAGAEAIEAITAYLSIVEGAARRAGIPDSARLHAVSLLLIRRYRALARVYSALSSAYERWISANRPQDPELTRLAIDAIRKAINFGLFAPEAVEEITTVARELGLLGRVREIPTPGEVLTFPGEEGGAAAMAAGAGGETA